MTSRTKVLILAAVLVVAGAQTFAQDAPVQAQASTWQRITTTVKVKVKEWLAYWKGGDAVQSAPALQTNGSVAGAPQGASANSPSGRASTPSVTAPTATSAKPVSAPSQKTAISVNEENQSLRKQKIFEREKGSSLQQIQALRESVKGAQIFKVAQPGRSGSSLLPRNKAGVPLADFKKVKVTKRIPELDIGLETLVSREEFAMDEISFGVGRPGDLKKLGSSQVMSDVEFRKTLGHPVAKSMGPRGLQVNMHPMGKAVTQESLSRITYAIKETGEAQALPYRALSEEQLKMIAALILFEQGNHCHMIMGLFHQLMAFEKTKHEASYYLGACADSLKMDQVAFDRLSQVVVAEDKDFGAQALELLSSDLPVVYERDFYNLIKNVKSFKNLITDRSMDAVSYRAAKGAYRAGDFKASQTYASRVNSSSEFHDHARFLAAMNSFALGEKSAALKKLQELSASLESRKVQDKNIRALTAVNLARMYFSQKKYDKALEQYMQVPKDHALWVQALIEQGWTQLALEDYAGAIGNMYSLHSPYFRAVYQPESFVVRTIGYLNICQYGDAYKTLSWLEKDYRSALTSAKNYLSANGQPLTIYETVKSYIKGKSNENVDGVPYQVWREMARRKDFLNQQTALNDKQDEARAYDGVNEKIKSEKASIRWHAEQSKKRFDQWKTQLVKAQTDKSLTMKKDEFEQNLRRERDLTIGYRFKLAILEQSRQGFLDFQGKAQRKLDTETAALAKRAGETLLKHGKRVQQDMTRVLDNNEFLRYEVFAGSGESIRYQVSGGQVGGGHRIPASIKPTKMMNWNFDGEFWEDEIGSYRSSLQNVCPTAATRQAKSIEDEN